MSRGFSLVELSIVLVILGLLTGGILAGQSLIRASELRTITTQYQNYVTAVQSFRDKYFALPGDMTNATQFWKAAAAPIGCAVTQGTGTQTCDGNGDGRIEYNVSTSNESFRFWQQLANAGLIEGSYTGINAGPGVGYVSTADNVPRGRISNALWWTEYWAAGTAGDAMRFAARYDNLLLVGGQRSTGDPLMPILKPEEMWNIDVKMDDGKPALGKVGVVAFNGLSLCTTTVANNPATSAADYLLNSSAVECAPYFRQVF